MNWGNGECFIELDEVTDWEQVRVISNPESECRCAKEDPG